jgi:type II secretory pathway pseudopilin PulG
MEMLVTVAVIGVLASIAVATFSGPSARGRDEEAQHAVRAALQAASAFYLERRLQSGSFIPDPDQPGSFIANPYDWGYNLLTVRDIHERAPALSGDPAAPEQRPGDAADPAAIYLKVLSRWEVVICSASKARTVFCAKDSRLQSNDADAGVRTYAKSSDPSETIQEVADNGVFGPSW